MKYLNYLINQREIITPTSPKASQTTDTKTPTVNEKKNNTNKTNNQNIRKATFQENIKTCN